MQPQEQHTMMIAQEYPTGAEEWFCPTCGRRFVMQWPPVYKKIILDEGDAMVIHNGARGEIQMNIQGMETSEPPEADFDEDTLDPWLEYLEDMDLDRKLDDNSQG